MFAAAVETQQHTRGAEQDVQMGDTDSLAREKTGEKMAGMV